MCVVLSAKSFLLIYCLHGGDRLAQNPLTEVLELGIVSMVSVQSDQSLGIVSGNTSQLDQWFQGLGASGTG